MSLWGGAALVLAMQLFACGGDPTDPGPADASTDVGSDADPAALRRDRGVRGPADSRTLASRSSRGDEGVLHEA